jgi:glycosyltransferase involved in cell wall biosynthesis
MRVAFDAKRAFLNHSGLGNYARSFIQSLSTHFAHHHYSLFTTAVGSTLFSKKIMEQKNISVICPKKNIPTTYWRSFGITSQLKNIEVYHGLSNELPFTIRRFKGKKIVTIHDLIFIRYPELYSYVDRKMYDIKFSHACKQADTIVAVSEQTKKDIVAFYNISPEKIKVIYQSCDEPFYQEPLAQAVADAKEKHKLPEKYLLYVGTIEERKNLLTLIKALTLVKTIPLVVVGRKREYYAKVMEYIRANRLENRVIFLENSTSHDLPPIYRGAELFIYPSIFEGFGIPIIEALTCKTPVITTAGGCFNEAGGPHSVYINPLDHEQLAAEMKILLDSPTARKQMSDHGYEYAKRFMPQMVANEMMNLYIS